MLHGRMLRYLDEIARAGSIRKAASRLNVAASSINRQLLALEEDVGAPVFERSPRGLRLTAAGELLIDHVRQTLKDSARVRMQIRALRGLVHGEVRIVTVGSLAVGFLAAMVRDFHGRHPQVRLTVRVRSLEGIIADVESGEADLALAYDVPKGPRLRRMTTVELPLYAAMAPDHPLADRFSLRLADCLAFPLALAEPDMSLRALFEAALPDGADYVPLVEANSVELLRKSATRAPVITFLNQIDGADEWARGELFLVPVREFQDNPQRLTLVHRANAPLATEASLFSRELELLMEGMRRSPEGGRNRQAAAAD